jgi:hypothetical protein
MNFLEELPDYSHRIPMKSACFYEHRKIQPGGQQTGEKGINRKMDRAH